MEIREFQLQMKDAFLDTDTERGTFRTFAWLVEEVGELASALNGKTGRDNLADEFADVFAWLCSLANLSGIDLQQACGNKYGKELNAENG